MNNHSKNTEDTILWNQICKGDEKAFHQLFEKKYRPLMIFGLKIKMDRELVRDLIQDLFLELWNKRFSLPHVENLNAYLKQILKRKIFHASKKQLKVVPHDKSLSSEKVSSYESLLIEQETSEIKKSNLEKAFQELTPKQKEIILLKFYKGLSYEEIANKTGTQKRTIYNQVHSAVLILKKYLLLNLCLLYTSPSPRDATLSRMPSSA